MEQMLPFYNCNKDKKEVVKEKQNKCGSGPGVVGVGPGVTANY